VRQLTRCSDQSTPFATRSGWRFLPAVATKHIWPNCADCLPEQRRCRTCRRQGKTVRKLIDCLIAAVAIEAGCEVLHADADFNVLARRTALRVHSSSLPDSDGD
jgi:predicted nucleic acid-binding protein